MFDDRETVLLNPSLIVAWNWSAAVLHNVARPVVNLSYLFDRGMWGFSSFGFHITNVVLHITAVGLFYGWCTRALTDARMIGGKRPSEWKEVPEWGAFFAASVFALHPVMSAAVGYVTGRSELLAAVAFLAALTFARRAIVAASWTAGLLAGAFGALAIGSSSSAAALPLLILAYDAWVVRDGRWTVRRARIYAPAMLAVGVAAAWYLTGLRWIVVPPRSTFENLLTGARVVWRYLGLLLVPSGQAIVHDVHWATSPLDPVGLLLLLALAGAVSFAVWHRRTHPLAAFGMVWFLAVLAPTTSLIPVRDVMAEHRLYLAAAGLLLAAASFAGRPLATRRAAQAILAVVLAVLAFGTYRRNAVWSEPMRLWDEAVRRSPDAWQAHWGFGELLREIGQCDRARTEYDAVLRLHPAHPGARAGLEACR